MSDPELTQEQEQISESKEEGQEDSDGGDPEEALALSEEERLARQRASHEARR